MTNKPSTTKIHPLNIVGALIMVAAPSRSDQVISSRTTSASGTAERMASLPTGSMLVSHPLWRAPVVVRFPRPLHRLAAEAR
jgi:hypothetical protein